jgi:hypothetical protein
MRGTSPGAFCALWWPMNVQRSNNNPKYIELHFVRAPDMIYPDSETKTPPSVEKWEKCLVIRLGGAGITGISRLSQSSRLGP